MDAFISTSRGSYDRNCHCQMHSRFESRHRGCAMTCDDMIKVIEQAQSEIVHFRMMSDSSVTRKELRELVEGLEDVLQALETEFDEDDD